MFFVFFKVCGIDLPTDVPKPGFGLRHRRFLYLRKTHGGVIPPPLSYGARVNGFSSRATKLLSQFKTNVEGGPFHFIRLYDVTITR